VWQVTVNAPSGCSGGAAVFDGAEVGVAVLVALVLVESCAQPTKTNARTGAVSSTVAEGYRVTRWSLPDRAEFKHAVPDGRRAS
jgi:hypothetical protein